MFLRINKYFYIQAVPCGNPLTGVNNVKATDRRRRYGSDGAQSCA